MPTGPILCRAILPSVSGLAQDVAINDFAFNDSATYADAAAQVVLFYNGTWAGQTQPMSTYLAGTIRRTALACHVAVHALDTPAKLAGGPLGSPILDLPFTMGAASAERNMASEVAAVMSLRAAYTGAVEEAGGTRPRSRRRGRVFLGPLNIGAGTNSNVAPCRPLAVFRGDVCLAAFQLGGTVLASLGVWSRSDQVVREAVDVRCDDAFDTQRRRGVAKTTETLLAFP